MGDKHIFNKETEAEQLAMDIVSFLQKWGMWEAVQIFAGGKCYSDGADGILEIREEKHPERYLVGPVGGDCEGTCQWKEFSNAERLLDMTFEGPFSLLLRHHEYETNMGNVSEEARRQIFACSSETIKEGNQMSVSGQDEVTALVVEALEGKYSWDPAEFDSYEEWLELNEYCDLDDLTVRAEEIKTNPLEISTREEYGDYLAQCEVIREQKIWDYFEDDLGESSEDENTVFFDDGGIASIVVNEFSELLAGYGLWYDLGFSWSLTAYRV